MKTSPNWARAALILIVPLLVLALLPSASKATSAGFAGVTAAAPVFLQQVGTPQLPAAPSAGQARLGTLGTSVIPPGPAPGERCSVGNAPANCSALLASERCSALNDQGNQCSALSDTGLIGANNRCSAFATNAACSVLPTGLPPGNPSQCSSLAPLGTPPRCSAVGTASRQLCSAKGAGLSQARSRRSGR